MAGYRVYFYDVHKHIVKAEVGEFETQAAACIWADTLFREFTQYPVMELWRGGTMLDRRERTA